MRAPGAGTRLMQTRVLMRWARYTRETEVSRRGRRKRRSDTGLQSRALVRYLGLRAMPRKTRSSRRILPKLRSAADRGVLFEAAFLLPTVSLALRTIGWARVQRFIERKPFKTARCSLEEARHIAGLVEAVTRRSPLENTCLQRSVVLWRVLRRRQFEAELRFGVRKADGVPQFHAWVEHDGEVLNDVQHVRERFSAFGLSRLEKEDS